VATTVTEKSREGGQLLRALASAKQKSRIFPAGHPYAQEAAQVLLEVLHDTMGTSQHLHIHCIHDEVYLNGALLARESVQYSELIEGLTGIGINSLSFNREASIDELAAFLGLLQNKREDIEKEGGWVPVISKKGIKGVKVNRFVAFQPGLLTSDNMAKASRISREAYRTSMMAVMEAFADTREGSVMNVNFVEEVVRFLMGIVAENESTIFGMKHIKATDDYTFYHSVNVAIVSLLIASHLRMGPEDLALLGVSALLHDIGKVNIPSELITKPAALTDEERRVFESHPVEGAKILLNQADLNRVAVRVALEHHMRVDKQGYPRIKLEGELHPYSRIVEIADVFDALTSDRAYRRAFLPDRAMEILLAGRGTHVDDRLMKLFVTVAGIFPVGTLVELDTRELAVVTDAEAGHIFRPKVKILRDHQGQTCQPFFVDLSAKQDGSYDRIIVQSVSPDDADVVITDHF